jgi:hypothetical protein
MIRAKPVSLRRKSFGGQSGIGIWWRKRSYPTSVAVPAEEDEEERTQDDLSNDPSTTELDTTSEDDNPNSNTIEEPRPAEMKRKKKAYASTSEISSPPSNYLRTSKEATILGWDDDLCRPIYHHQHRVDATATATTATTSDDSLFDTSEELVRAVSSGDSGVAEASETDVSTDAVDDESSCLEGEKGDVCTDSVAILPAVAANNKKPKAHRRASSSTASDEDEDEVSFRIPSLSRIRTTRTFGNRGKRRRPLSLILTQEQEAEAETDTTPMTVVDRGSRRISLESVSKDADEVEHRDSGSDSDEVGRMTPPTDHESSNQKQSKTKRQRRSKKPQSDSNNSNSLEKAREYFANLDQTQPLVLEYATTSPPVSSRVTRTHRKTNLASPGINRAYKAYAKSIAGIGSGSGNRNGNGESNGNANGDSSGPGLSPLSIRDYASSRQLHFQNKGEIVDGFLDD